MLKLGKSLERKNSIDITPLVDVVFILLIFFMVSSRFVEQPGIKLSLPKASSSRPAPGSYTHTITIAPDLRMFLGGQEIDPDELPRKLKGLMDNSSNKVLIIKADKTVPHGEVVKVMDIARQSGVKKLVVSTKVK